MLQPELANRLRDRKIANIDKVVPDLIAAGNIGCITQIAAGTGYGGSPSACCYSAIRNTVRYIHGEIVRDRVGDGGNGERHGSVQQERGKEVQKAAVKHTGAKETKRWKFFLSQVQRSYPAPA